MSHKAEYTMLGVVLGEYRDAVQMIDGCLTTARNISRDVDPDKADSLAACQEALLDALAVVDGLLADRPRES